MFLTKDILSPLQLKRISDHKYSSSGRTLMDPIVQPFWNWLVQKLPLWLAPNLMTVMGLFINILTSIILICYSPDGTREVTYTTFLECICFYDIGEIPFSCYIVFKYPFVTDLYCNNEIHF